MCTATLKNRRQLFASCLITDAEQRYSWIINNKFQKLNYDWNGMAMSREGAASSDLLLNPESMNNKLHQVLINALMFFYRKEHTHCTIEKLPKLKKKTPNPNADLFFFLHCSNGCCRPALSTCQGSELWDMKLWQRPPWEVLGKKRSRQKRKRYHSHSWPKAGENFVVEKVCAYGKKPQNIPCLKKLKVLTDCSEMTVGFVCSLPVTFFLTFAWELSYS